MTNKQDLIYRQQSIRTKSLMPLRAPVRGRYGIRTAASLRA
ncbi:hypothetical protein SNOG_14699 [Parastagonospora nodorum SN15]|uniref:Uncharacterized protein n=1 Tax=Phaeosphaeria nodorum (strain SN15 / ATCC MYA-4574 / FGSC 10173) TaxID=321614 RepID=Q0U0I4_PHANO|nr:hypothetical protein SNOG_14699 [Parastagonospora nodorum SN15]EAT77891.1 hypothetical protein SNOG_14699 [Parastagonospora nodorum SN15]